MLPTNPDLIFPAYGTIVSSVVVMQILGWFWHSPAVFGDIWARRKFPEGKCDGGGMTTNLIMNALMDTAFVILVNYLQSYYFRADSLIPVLIFTAIISVFHFIPSARQTMWGKSDRVCFLIEQGYNILCAFIAVCSCVYIHL